MFECLFSSISDANIEIGNMNKEFQLTALLAACDRTTVKFLQFCTILVL